jgi:uncharacterized protein
MAKFQFIEWLVEFINRKNFLFDWDEGNREKSLLKHGLNFLEAEDAFNDQYLVELGMQVLPKTSEERFGVIARTAEGKILFISFTIRNGMIRVISLRNANRKEKEIYEV